MISYLKKQETLDYRIIIIGYRVRFNALIDHIIKTILKILIKNMIKINYCNKKYVKIPLNKKFKQNVNLFLLKNIKAVKTIKMIY